MPALLIDPYEVYNGGALVLETEYYQNKNWNQVRYQGWSNPNLEPIYEPKIGTNVV